MKFYSLGDLDPEKFIVCYMGETTHYMSFNNPQEFAKYYKYTIRKHYYEVINQNLRRMIFDIDQRVTISHLAKMCVRIEKLTNQIPRVFDSSNNEVSSYHIVIPNLYFTVLQCKQILLEVDKENVCDQSVYKSVQLFRIEGSTKFKEQRPKYAFGRKSMSENFLNYLSFNKSLPKSVHATSCNIPGIYNAKLVNKSLIKLLRTKPGLCQTCDRIHDRENAYLFWKEDSWNFVCFRNPTVYKKLTF